MAMEDARARGGAASIVMSRSALSQSHLRCDGGGHAALETAALYTASGRWTIAMQYHSHESGLLLPCGMPDRV
jgi:hypothetical protein